MAPYTPILGRILPSLPPPSTLKTWPPPWAAIPRTATWEAKIVPSTFVETICCTASGVVSTMSLVVWA